MRRWNEAISNGDEIQMLLIRSLKNSFSDNCFRVGAAVTDGDLPRRKVQSNRRDQRRTPETVYRTEELLTGNDCGSEYGNSEDDNRRNWDLRQSL
jgi:hypothetical protein